MNEQEKVKLENLPQSVKIYIDQLERIRKDFVANVSHELRTPLTVIRGYLESLIENNSNEIPSHKEILHQMLEHSIRMECIINDLLFLSRIESDDASINKQETVLVPKILKTLRSDAEKISGRKNHFIQLECDSTLMLHGFPEELKSLFSNIIVNAVKYTMENEKIIIKWYLKDSKATFSVSDTGIGIEKENIPKITERFFRVDKGRSRESGGTGLGLAIVKHILTRHQGELIIDSTLGKGSTFSCIFPKERTIIATD